MTQQDAPTKTQLLEALRTNGQEILAKLGALPVDVFEQGRYESGWNGREILAHMASIEWTYPRLIDIAREGASAGGGSAKPSASKGTADTPTRSARGGILSYNERQVQKRAQASVDELLAEFRENRAATIAAVESTEEALLATPITSAGGITGPLSRVIFLTAVAHTHVHTNDILGG